MEKVKVSQEIADAIVEAKDNYSLADLIKLHFHRNSKWFNDLDLDTFIRALYIGYEVEQTPEDKVRNYYERLDKDPPESPKAVVADVLDLLNITIKGVNDL